MGHKVSNLGLGVYAAVVGIAVDDYKQMRLVAGPGGGQALRDISDLQLNRLRGMAGYYATETGTPGCF